MRAYPLAYQTQAGCWLPALWVVHLACPTVAEYDGAEGAMSSPTTIAFLINLIIASV